MNIVDIILLVLLGAFILFGFWFGAIHTFGSLVGAVVGTIAAGMFQGRLGELFASIFGRPELMKIIAFLLIFIVAARLVGFVFYWLDQKFDFLKDLPFMGGVDRLIGAGIGFIEGMLVIGLSLYVISQAQIDPKYLAAIEASRLAPWFIGVSIILQALLPKSFTQ